MLSRSPPWFGRLDAHSEDAAPCPSNSSKPRETSERERPRASSLPCPSGSPETEPSTSGHRSSVSKARHRYFWRPPRRRIAKGGTSGDPPQAPEAKTTHFRKLARSEKPERDTYRTPEGFQRHLPGTIRTPEGFPKPKADTFCNPRGCKKYLPRAFQTSDSLTEPDADVFGQLRHAGPTTRSRGGRDQIDRPAARGSASTHRDGSKDGSKPPRAAHVSATHRGRVWSRFEMQRPGGFGPESQPT